jgi:hypothetical protein
VNFCESNDTQFKQPRFPWLFSPISQKIFPNIDVFQTGEAELPDRTLLADNLYVPKFGLPDLKQMWQ